MKSLTKTLFKIALNKRRNTSSHRRLRVMNRLKFGWVGEDFQNLIRASAVKRLGTSAVDVQDAAAVQKHTDSLCCNVNKLIT